MQPQVTKKEEEEEEDGERKKEKPGSKENFTGISSLFKSVQSSSSRQQACPILLGRKSSIARISTGLGTYKH